MSTPHRLISPESMSPSPGFSHAVVPADGRTVYLAGQIAADPTGAVLGDRFAEQYDVALGNVVEALAHVGGEPHDIVSMVVYATDVQAYRDDLRGVGAAHRKHLNRHFPAMALLGTTGLVEPDAMVEIIATAVVPD